MSENTIIIPIYNDWKSLNKLLAEINIVPYIDVMLVLVFFGKNDSISIEDSLDKIKEIKILSLKENLGSQKRLIDLKRMKIYQIMIFHLNTYGW